MDNPGRERLADRRALVTGATGGQGAAVARQFAAEGARVALTDLDVGELERLAAELRGRGAEAIPVDADVRDEAAVEHTVRTAVETFGGLDVLYNNAGVYWPARDAPADRLDRAVWDEILAINTTGVFLFCKHALPHLLGLPGSVILNVASVAAYAGDAECHAYAASKGALIALTRSIAQRYGPQGLRAVAICPGFIETPMISRLLEDESFAARVTDATALRRVGLPDEVARLAVFLASTEASFVTSAVVAVHGGLDRA